MDSVPEPKRQRPVCQTRGVAVSGPIGDAAAAMTAGTTDTPPPGRRQDGARTPVSVAEAADRLGITHDAVRKKLQRGTLPGEKIAGEWRAFLPPAAPKHDAGQDDRQDATGTRQDTARTATDPLVEQLRSENAFLREQLAQRSHELAAERERFDVLHREALGRIPRLGAVGDAPQKNQQIDGEAIATDPAPDAPKTGAPQRPVQRSWWRFWEREEKA